MGSRRMSPTEVSKSPWTISRRFEEALKNFCVCFAFPMAKKLPLPA
jgi:hypothetical protein